MAMPFSRQFMLGIGFKETAVTLIIDVNNIGSLIKFS